MKLSSSLLSALTITFLIGSISTERINKRDARSSRPTRQTSADQMVQNILRWLQGVYTQQSRRIRQGTLKEYLPPSNTQKPRPFMPPGDGVDEDGNFVDTGYPPAGSVTPKPPFPIYTYQPAVSETVTPGVPEYSTKPETSEVPGIPSGYPEYTSSTEEPSPRPQVIITETPIYPGPESTSHETYIPPETTGYPTPGYSEQSGSPETPSYTSQGTETTSKPEIPSYSTSEQSVPQTEGTPSSGSSEGVYTSPGYTPEYTPETEKTQEPVEPEPTGTSIDEDLKHPPHIHEIEVECAKDMMTINIEFNRVFNGIIYSKGYYNMPECRYVQENSGQVKYRFTVNLNMCGTEFVNAFDTQGQSYLENILVLQNEAGVQEIWDTVRSVRCLWEGNLKEQLSASLMVGMLTQEIVTFSGDTAMAKLDILLGRGPTGQTANGLVKIGEPMTLVVSVSGDPGFDIQVKDCRAVDSTGTHSIQLTDDDGCILKPKLFGAFQKTRSTGDSGASIIAYAYFNAFKFPDLMDLMIECNIELCKTDCEMCPNADQQLEPGRRRRRDITNYNVTLHDGVSMGKHIRVVLPEDLATATFVTEGVCMSTPSFIISSSLLISLLTASCLFSAYMWLKAQRIKFKY